MSARFWMGSLFVLGLCLALLTLFTPTGAQTMEIHPSTEAGCAEEPNALPSLKLLVFSKTAGYRHDSIASGIEALEALQRLRNWIVTAAEDAQVFNEDDLSEIDVVIFLSTTGDILDAQQQAAFERFIENGGGFVGIHSASDTEYDWEWYGGLVGAYFADHPAITEANIVVENPSHPAAKTLPEIWTRQDEWYNFRANPRAEVNVILALDETSYAGGTMSGDHPIAWAHEVEGGRAFYTGLGHTIESFSEPLFLDHLIGGIEWAGGRCPAQPAEEATDEAQ
jgi:cytochrome c